MSKHDFKLYYKIATTLSNRSKTHRWDPTDIIEVEVEGVKYNIGPFHESYFESYGENFWVASLSPEDDLCLAMSEEEWSSWGDMYDDSGNDFQVVQRVNPRTVYDYHDIQWEILDEMSKEEKQELLEKYRFPPRERW